jgi:hypothetical protein
MADAVSINLNLYPQFHADACMHMVMVSINRNKKKVKHKNAYGFHFVLIQSIYIWQDEDI